MKLDTVLESKRYYKGKPLESGGTSIQGGAAPAIKWLDKQGVFTDKIVLDYGAGKYGRNANYLRKMGMRVYAYDPFNGTDADGWEGVSNKLPQGMKFDVAFTSFVMNVIPHAMEDDIVATLKRFAKKQYHVTRNRDIYDTVKKAMARGDKTVTEFYQTYFNKMYSPGVEYGTKEILDFCHFGVQTSRGFQRIPELEDKGFKPMLVKAQYKVYEK